MYRVIDTDETFEVSQSMKDDPITHDEQGRAVERVPQVPMFIIDSEKPKTLGSLAEQNTERMKKQGDARVQLKQKTERPWWRPNKDKPIDTSKMSKAQIKRYIKEGKI